MRLMNINVDERKSFKIVTFGNMVKQSKLGNMVKEKVLIVF